MTSGPRLALALLVAALAAPAASAPRTDAPGFEDVHARALILRAEDERDGRDAGLHAALAHPRAEIRARAVRALGRIGDPTTVPRVAAAVGDGSQLVRREAIFALGEIESPDAFGTLAQATLDKDPVVRARAAEALAKLAWGADPRKDVAAALVVSRFLGGAEGRLEPDTESLVRVLQSAWRFGANAPGLAAAISSLAASADVATADAALYAAARLGDASVGATLETAASSTRPMARVLAARGLARLARADREAKREMELSHRGVLLQLAADENAVVRVEALRGLAAFDAPEEARAMAVLEASLPGASDPGVVRAGLELAAAWKLAPSAPLVRQVLSRGDRDALADAAAALAAIEGPAAVPALSALAESADWRVRAAVAAALSPESFGLDASGRALQDRLLADTDARVVQLALEAAAASKREDRGVLVLGHLASPDVVVRAVAISLLPGLVGSGLTAEEAEWSLRDAFARAGDDRDADARVSALDALSEMRAADEADLVRLLEHADPVVRARAAQHLEKLRGEVVARPVVGIGRPLTFYLDAALDETIARPRVLRLVTDRGTIDVDLLPQEAVLTVRALTDLAAAGYFDGLTFHRVVPGFVAQGGCPRGDGWGGPGTTLRCEVNPLTYRRGAAGMALSGKDTGGSQFFFTLMPHPHLDGGYTIFGQVRPRSLPVIDQLRRHDVIRKAEVRWPRTAR